MLTNTAIHLFLAHCGAKGLSNQTIKWYSGILKNFASTNNTVPLSPAKIEGFLSGCKAGDERRHGNFRALRALYHWLHKRYKVKNVMELVDAPKRKAKSPRFLTADDLDQLLSFPHKTSIRAYLMFLADTGCRVGELYNLKPQDFSESAWGILARVNGKTGERIIPVTHEVYTAIQPYLPIEYSIYWLRRIISRAFHDAHVAGSAHTLRHTFGALWSGDEMVLQRIMGHSHLTTTQIYRHLATKRLSEQHNQFSPLKMVFARTRNML